MSEGDEKASALWMIAAIIVLLPAILLVFAGITWVASQLRYLFVVPYSIAEEGGMAIAGFLALAAISTGAAFPQRWQSRKMKCFFALFSCGGVASLGRFISYFRGNLSLLELGWLLWWLLMGPLAVGVAAVYRILWFRHRAKPIKVIALLAGVILCCLGALCWYSVKNYLYPKQAEVEICQQREAALAQKVETIKTKAHEKLKIGTKKSDVVQFYKENGIDVSIDEPGALDGHIEVPGLSACRTFACGSDDATIRVYVKLDPAGAVLSEPKVYSGYRNCL